MEVASSIGGKVIELTVEPIGRQFGYVIFYHRNVTRLREALQELHNHRCDVQTMVDAARRQGEEISKVVECWFTSVDKTTEDADALYAKESNGNTDCSWRSCPNLWLRHQISRKANKLAMQIQKHKDDGKFDKVSHPIHPKLVGVPPISEEHDEHIESRISIRNQVLEALKGSSSSRVGLWGLPGAGKTTLAKEIAHIANEHKEIFGLVVWVTVAHNSKIESLQKQIAENAGMKLGVETVTARAGHLVQRLEKEKNLLVVLDDLWESFDLGLLGILPPVDRSNYKCRILFTSRNEDLLENQMGCKNNFQVGVLTEEEAWKLFKENAELDESIHTELVPIAKDVCQLCGKLPLALVSVARALKNKGVDDWCDALRRLQKCLTKSMTLGKDINSALKLSYDYLNNERKSIFLLSAMMSHDPLIKDILVYALGLGLLEGVHSMKEAHNALGAVIGKLKASSLLLDSYSDDRVTMHDLFRDFAFEEEEALVRLKGQDPLPRKTVLEDCTRLCLENWDRVFPEELHCPKLELFLLNGDYSNLIIPGKFLESLTELQAMGFTRVNFLSLPALSHLDNLQTLCLHSCEIEDMSEVGNLKSLKILSLADSTIERLPRELSHLTCLQVLDLSDCRSLKVIPQKVLSSLTNLEVLNMRNSFCQWEAQGSMEENRNARLDELKHLTNLYDLNITIPHNLDVPEDLFNGMHLERYIISYGSTDAFSTDAGCSRKLEMGSVNLDDEMQQFLGKVQHLCLYDVKVKTNVLGGTLLPRQCVGLECLEVQYCKSIEAIVGSTNKDSTDVIVFHALRTLNLRNMPMLSAFHKQEEEISANSKSLFNRKISLPKIEKLDLRELNTMVSSIWDDRLQENSFTNLKTLKVENCGFMGRLVPFHVLKSLKHLEKVAVKYCDKVEVVFDFEELNGEEIQSPALISVPLKKLSLYKLPELKHVWSNWPQEVSFPYLEEVKISKCERLTGIFPLSQLQEEYPLFPHQKEIDGEKVNIMMNETGGINHLIMDDGPEAPLGDGSKCFRSLRKLEIGECKSLEYIFMASSVAKESPKFVFHRLESLQLVKLHDLKGFCRQKCTYEWPRLTELWVSQCENLKVFGTEMTSTTESGGKDEFEDLQTPLFLAEKVIPNLNMLSLSQKDVALIKNHPFETNLFDEVVILLLGGFFGESAAASASFPYDCLERFPKVSNIRVEHSDFEEIFSSQPQQRAFSCSLVMLWLSCLDELNTIWNDDDDDDDSQLQPLRLTSLEVLVVECCCNLIKLIPSSASLGNLLYLKVSGCHQLTYMFTDSTAKSFVNLYTLEVKDCKRMEEIVRNESEEDAVVVGGGGAGITFNRLSKLELDALPSLEGFCLKNQTFKFPRLSDVDIKGCHQMKMFSLGVSETPDLRNVKIDDIRIRLNGDLNRTVELFFSEKDNQSIYI